MNILQAYELAKQGKTVISPLGTEWRQSDFETPNSLALHHVTGEWKEKREPVVFETRVLDSSYYDDGCIVHELLVPTIGKRVKVTVEVIDDQA